MAEISRATLFGKLNPLMFKAAEGAVTFCKLRGNPHVELVHWLFQIVNMPDSDVHRILRHFEIDSARLVARPPGHAGAAAARRLDHRGLLRARALRREGGLDVRDPPVRGLAGAQRLPAGRAPQERPPARRAARGSPASSHKIKVETLTDDFARIVKGSPEDGLTASDGFAAGGARRGEPRHPARGHGQAGGAPALRLRPHGAGARGRHRSRHRAATRRSGRSSTS